MRDGSPPNHSIKDDLALKSILNSTEHGNLNGTDVIAALTVGIN